MTEITGAKKLILWGAGGHGKVILDAAKAMDVFDKITFVDDAQDGSPGRFLWSGGSEFRSVFPAPRMRIPGSVVSIGDNRVRAACFEKALSHGLSPATIVHPSALIANSAHLGEGTVVMPAVVVNAGAEIGRNCILNTAAIIEHDCRIGEHVHISPGVLLAGGVTVESLAHVGIGAIAIPGSQIGAGSIVGAGAVVIYPVPPGVTVVGIPAKPIARRSS